MSETSSIGSMERKKWCTVGDYINAHAHAHMFSYYRYNIFIDRNPSENTSSHCLFENKLRIKFLFFLNSRYIRIDNINERSNFCRFSTESRPLLLISVLISAKEYHHHH